MAAIQQPDGGCLSLEEALRRGNIFVERLWKTVEYEEVYLHAYDIAAQARQALKGCFDFCNQHRPHTGLDDKTPNMALCLTLINRWRTPQPEHGESI